MKLPLLAIGLFFVSTLSFAKVTITQGQVRLPPPLSTTSAGFLTLHNQGKQDITLIGATSPIAEKLEIHNHILVGDMLKMRKQDKLAIKAGESVVFESGGLHLMFIGLKHKLNAGQKVPVTLNGSQGEKIDFVLEVQDMMAGHHHHSHH